MTEFPPQQPGPAGDADTARAALTALRAEVGKAVVGQDAVVTGLVIALLCRGHVLLEGVPGTAKTLLVRALAASLAVSTRRLQFTPDLMPGDVTGSLVYDARTAEFSFKEGPVFTNLLLADEINRTPPKTQAALLESMEERQVSVDGRPRPLPDPFLVAATQNPIEYEGTYALPEAQIDRFLLKLAVNVPAREDEIAVLQRHASGFDPRDLSALRPVAGPAELAAGRAAVATVAVTPEVLGYIVDVARATRSAPSRAAGRLPPRRHRPAGLGPGLGLAVRPRLRHPGRRQGAGPAGPAAPGAAAPGGRARGRDRGRRPRRRAGHRPGTPLRVLAAWR